MREPETRRIQDSYPERLRWLFELGEGVESNSPELDRMGRGDAKDLIRMLTDMRLHELPDWDPASWAPIGALHALWWHRVVAAMGPALEMLEPVRLLGTSELFGWSVRYLGRLGIEALPALEAYVSDPAIHVESRVKASLALGFMGMEIGGQEEQPCIEAIRRMLAPGEQVPVALRCVLIAQLNILEDPDRGLNQKCPLCRMMLDGDWEEG